MAVKTQLTPTALPGRRYGSFAGRTAVTPPTPTFTLAEVLERVGGARVSMLFDLTVSKPTPKTWYLAPKDLATPTAGFFDPDTFVPGVFATGLAGTTYRGLVLEHSGVAAAAALGGVAGESGVALTLINALGTGEGAGRRFMDAFATPVDGYAEPYDLLTATLQCRLYAEDAPGDPRTVGGGLHLQPESFQWSGAPGTPERVQLVFGPDERRYRRLPRHRITKTRYPHAPDSVLNQPIIPWLGTGLRVPLLALDADGSRWLIGASPAATPLGAVTRLWTIRPDTEATDSSAKPVVLPVKITTANEAVLTIPPNATDTVTLKSVAQRFELDGDGAFIYAVTVRLRRASAGTACKGSVTISIVLDEDGLPGTTLVDGNASAEISAAIVATGVLEDYTIPFQANKEARPAYLPPNRGLWVITTFAKDDTGVLSGNMLIAIDSTGGYADGLMATKDTASDAQWILAGRQQRRKPVRMDYTGIGQLGRNVNATGTERIRAWPPVTIRGL